MIEPLELPTAILDGSIIDEWLREMAKVNASDMFISSSNRIMLDRYNEKIQWSDRELRYEEVLRISEHIYGSDPTSQINAKKPINCPYGCEKIELSNGGIGRSGVRLKDANNLLRFRVNLTSCENPNQRGIVIVIREIPVDPPRAEDVGLDEKLIREIRSTNQGMVLVCGATGSGKSTSLAAINRTFLEDPNGNQHLVTIEHPIEFTFFTVNKPSSIVHQLQVGRDVSSFAEGVSDALRKDPSIILVGESRDRETVEASMEAALTGHLLESTVHANKAAVTMKRMTMVFDEGERSEAQITLCDSMKIIIAQTLVKGLELPRVAVRETLIFDSDVNNRLAYAKNISHETQKCVEEYGVPMAEHAFQLYKDRKISSDELEKIQKNYKVLGK